VPETPLTKGCNDVGVGRCDQATPSCVSLLLSAFRLLYVAMRTKEQPMRHHALYPRKFRWHKYGTPEVRVDSRKVEFLIQAIVSPLTNVRCLSDLAIDFYAIDSGSW
jgi:hypothetical protein